MSYFNEELKIANVISGWMWPRELVALYNLFRESKSHVEIGSFCGKSLYITSAAMSNGKIYCVENFKSGYPVEWVYKTLNVNIEHMQKQHSNKIELIEGNSIRAAQLFAEKNIQIDSVFIDGDHREAGVDMDIKSILPFLKKGGTIAGHDYWANDRGVMNAVNDNFTDFNVIENTRIWYAKK